MSATESPRNFLWLIPVIFVGPGIIFWLSKYYVPPAENTQFFVTAILAFGTLLVIIIQAVIYRSQWQAMRQSLEKTDSLLAKNDEMLEVVRQQSEHAKAQVESMDKQLEVMRFQSNVTKAQAETTDKQLDVMRESLKQADEHFFALNRAEVVIDELAFVLAALAPSGSNPFHVSVLNGGRTPATNLTLTGHSILTRTPFDQLDVDHIVENNKTRGPALLVPDKPEIVKTNKIINFLPGEYDEWRRSSKRLYLQIAVWYTDIQDVQRVTFNWYEFTLDENAFSVIYSKVGSIAKPDLSKIWSNQT
jgi:hypothetical protein